MSRQAVSPPMTLPALRLPPLLMSVALLLAVCAGLWALVPREAPVTRLELRGHFERLDPQDVQAAAAPHLSSDFFTLDVEALRQALLGLPWVAQARVERQWPGTVEVRLVERVPYARWNDDGLLDTESRAFVPRAAERPADLPRLGGGPGHELEVAHAWDRLSPALAETALALSGLQLDVRGQWMAQARNGVELRFGTHAPDDKLALLRDVVLRTLGDRWEQVAYVDLRYTNGFAVGWREADTTGVKP